MYLQFGTFCFILPHFVHFPENVHGLMGQTKKAHTPRCALGFHVCVDSRRLTW